MLIQDKVKKLNDSHYNDGTKVFTLYLNTDPRDSEQQKGEWKIHLKNLLKDVGEKTMDSDSKKQFKTIQEKVEKEIYGRERELLRSHVLFATANGDVWFSESLQVPVETEYHWTDYPVLDQMKQMEETYPYAGIVTIQQDEALVLETEIGVLLSETQYELDLNTDAWRENQGPQGDDRTQGGANREEFKDRVQAHQQRWFKDLVSTIEKKAKDKGWKELYLVGEKEDVNALQSYFDKTIDKVVPRNLLNQGADSILVEVLDN